MLDQVNGASLSTYAVDAADVGSQFAQHLNTDKAHDTLETQNIFGIHFTKAGKEKSAASKLKRAAKIDYEHAQTSVRESNYSLARTKKIIDFVNNDPDLQIKMKDHMGLDQWEEKINFAQERNSEAQPIIDDFFDSFSYLGSGLSAEIWKEVADSSAEQAHYIHATLNPNRDREKERNDILSFMPKLSDEQRNSIYTETRGQQIYGTFGGGEGGGGGDGGGGGGDGG